METPLHTSKIPQTEVILSRTRMLLHSLAILALLCYRASYLLDTSAPRAGRAAWALAAGGEAVFAFLWALSQAFRWRPVERAVSGQGGPPRAGLPGLDVFVCTADPAKEPVAEVMNTVLSALALDYPPGRLAVYLSDDGGAPLTREAAREALRFGKVWVPFCRKHGIKTRCPEAFFSPFGDGERLDWNQEYKAEELLVKSKYEAFKEYVEKQSEDKTKCAVVHDRAPYVEIINDRSQSGDSEAELPLLVYVAREKRPTHPHRFKAGANNALLRISGIMSNAPYLLVLDCDMYCHDPTSAQQAMCFLLDPKMSPSLAFVTFPQIFYNAKSNDIYDGRARSALTMWRGMDGIRGPVLTGTGYYLKRKALYGRPQDEVGSLAEPEKTFGSSSKFIASLREISKPNNVVNKGGFAKDELLQEARNLATCTYESNTKWGYEVGYMYESLLEGTFTGYMLHCRGWSSVYLNPKRPCFLGCTTIDMKDTTIQLIKWTSSWVGVGLSSLSPLTYAVSRMSVLQSMCYGYLAFNAFFGVACLLYGIALPVCLLKGIPLFPKVSDPWIGVFVAMFAFSLAQHYYEVLKCGNTARTWWNEQRIWIMKSVTACLFGILDATMNMAGLKKATFRLTNKAVDKEKQKKYEKGKFDFQGAALFMVPLNILVVLNVFSFVGGLMRVIIHKNYDEMLAQLCLSLFLLALSYPILEGMVMKPRKGRS